MISGVCTAAWVSSGVLMYHDVPAGYDLLTTDVLKVAIVDAQNIDEFQIPAALFHSNRARIKEFLEHQSEFPDGFEQTVRDTLAQWNDFDIQFVAPADNADLTIVAYNQNDGYGGHATWPKSTDEDTYYFDSEEAIMFIQTDRFLNNGARKPRTLEELGYTVSHEFGHNVGITHTSDAAKNFIRDKDIESICSTDELKFIFGNSVNNSLMNQYGSQEAEFDYYTQQARDFIINHPAPVRARFVTPP